MSRSFVLRGRCGASEHVDVLVTCQIRFAGQAQYFCDVFITCVGIFRGKRNTLDVSSFIFVAGAALQTCRVACLLRIANWQGCAKLRFPICSRIKIGGSLSQNVPFEASACLVWSLWFRRVYGGSCNTFRFPMCPSVKIGGSL